MQIQKLCRSATRPFQPNPLHPLQSFILRSTDVPKERGTGEPHYNFPALNAMNHTE